MVLKSSFSGVVCIVVMPPVGIGVHLMACVSQVYQRMVTKLGAAKLTSLRVKLHMGSYGRGARSEVWVDDLTFFSNNNIPATCPGVQATSEVCIVLMVLPAVGEEGRLGHLLMMSICRL